MYCGGYHGRITDCPTKHRMIALFCFDSESDRRSYINHGCEHWHDHRSHCDDDCGGGSDNDNVLNDGSFMMISPTITCIASSSQSNDIAFLINVYSMMTRWQCGGTPLHNAAHEGKITIIDMLLDMGANIDALNNVSRETVLCCAVLYCTASRSDICWLTHVCVSMIMHWVRSE